MIKAIYWVYGCFGSVVGTITYLMVGKIVEAGMTTVICAFLAAVTKGLIDIFKKRYKARVLLIIDGLLSKVEKKIFKK